MVDNTAWDDSRQNSIANFQTVFTLLMNTSLLEYLFPTKYPSKRYGHKDPFEIKSVIGACMLVRKKAMLVLAICYFRVARVIRFIRVWI